jgi:hypothetical protein
MTPDFQLTPYASFSPINYQFYSSFVWGLKYQAAYSLSIVQYLDVSPTYTYQEISVLIAGNDRSRRLYFLYSEGD